MRGPPQGGPRRPVFGSKKESILGAAHIVGTPTGRPASGNRANSKTERKYCANFEQSSSMSRTGVSIGEASGSWAEGGDILQAGRLRLAGGHPTQHLESSEVTVGAQVSPPKGELRTGPASEPTPSHWAFGLSPHNPFRRTTRRKLPRKKIIPIENSQMTKEANQLP